MRAIRALFVLSPLLLTHCEFDLCIDAGALGLPSDVVGTSEDAIIGGTVDSANRATVVLLTTRADQTHALCSGTIIATSGDTGYVLTAAHCVKGTVDHVYQATDWYDCAGSGDASQCEATYTPLTWQAHPGYSSGSVENDFAIVTFSGATAATPVVPVVSGPDGLVEGQALELSGYGRNYSGANVPSQFQSERNHVTVSLDDVAAATLWFDASTGKTACFGDSGGPAYGHVNGARVVVGVAAAADPNCETVAIYGRVSSVYESFIAPLLPATAPQTCTSCLQSDMRTSAACSAERDACLSSSSCSALLACVEACATPDQACYVACAAPSPTGTVPFNALANCAACDACASACTDASCGSGAGGGGTGGAGGESPVGSGGGVVVGSGGDGSGSSGGSGEGGAGSHSPVGSGGAPSGGSSGGDAPSTGGSSPELPELPEGEDGCIPIAIACAYHEGTQTNSEREGLLIIGAIGAASALRRLQRLRSKRAPKIDSHR